MKRFPAGNFGRQRLEFFAAPFRAPLRAFAALVFAWDGDRVLVCDICDRGWCVPSGRIEPNEESIDAARREALEEAGAIIADVQYIGCYRVSERTEVRWADVFAARVEELREFVGGEESRDRRLAVFEELEGMYHLWNPLIEELFLYSREAVARRVATVNRFGAP